MAKAKEWEVVGPKKTENNVLLLNVRALQASKKGELYVLTMAHPHRSSRVGIGRLVSSDPHCIESDWDPETHKRTERIVPSESQTWVTGGVGMVFDVYWLEDWYRGSLKEAAAHWLVDKTPQQIRSIITRKGDKRQLIKIQQVMMPANVADKSLNAEALERLWRQKVHAAQSTLDDEVKAAVYKAIGHPDDWRYDHNAADFYKLSDHQRDVRRKRGDAIIKAVRKIVKEIK